MANPDLFENIVNGKFIIYSCYDRVEGLFVDSKNLVDDGQVITGPRLNIKTNNPNVKTNSAEIAIQVSNDEDKQGWKPAKSVSSSQNTVNWKPKDNDKPSANLSPTLYG